MLECQFSFIPNIYAILYQTSQHFFLSPGLTEMISCSHPVMLRMFLALSIDYTYGMGNIFS